MKEKWTKENKEKMVRAWVLTYHHPTERDHLWFEELSKKKGIRYLVVGREHTKTEGLHFQGYIAWNNGKNFKQAKRWFGLDKIHIEWAKGNDFQNQKYCSKENLMIEVGKPTKQGKRTDIEKALQIAKETGKIRDVLVKVSNYQAVRHVELYMKYLEPEVLRPDLQVINIWGPSGTGKTRFVYENEKDIFRPLNYKWWEGYDGHGTVLLDDIRKDFSTFGNLLKLLDIYPIRVECKGGSRQLRCMKIYITTPVPFVEMWQNREIVGDLYQLERRITQTYHIDDLL